MSCHKLMSNILTRNRKIEKGMNGIIQVANRYILIKRRYYFTPGRLAEIKNEGKCLELERMLEETCILIYHWWKCESSESFWDHNYAIFIQLKNTHIVCFDLPHF